MTILLAFSVVLVLFHAAMWWRFGVRSYEPESGHAAVPAAYHALSGVAGFLIATSGYATSNLVLLLPLQALTVAASPSVHRSARRIWRRIPTRARWLVDVLSEPPF